MAGCISDTVAVTQKTRRISYTFVPTADSGTEASAQFKPLIGAVLPIDNLFGEASGQTTILQVRVLEDAVSGTLKKNALLIHVYDNAASPATPAIDTAYDTVLPGLLASFKVKAGSATADAPNVGYRDLSSTKARATLLPGETVKSSSTSSTAGKLVVLFDAAGTVYNGTTDELTIELVVQDLIQCG